VIRLLYPELLIGSACEEVPLTDCNEQFIYTEAITLRLPYQIMGYATIVVLVIVNLFLLGALFTAHPPLSAPVSELIYYGVGAIVAVLISAWSVFGIRSLARAARNEIFVTLRGDGLYVQMAAPQKSMTKSFS
jgi:hypothetical protein